MIVVQKIWPVALLGDLITEMQPGFAQRPQADGDGFPQLRPNNISNSGKIDLSEIKYVRPSANELDKYLVRKGDVIFNNTNSPDLVGRAAYFDQDDEFVLSNHMTLLRVSADLLDAEFLAVYIHYLWQIGASIRWAKQWVNQAAIDQSALAKFPIPLPPLPEQRRIVAILRKADELRQLRQRANQRARDLLPALFYEMFGDPMTNPKGWSEKTLDTCLEEIRYGTGSPPPYIKQGHPFIRATDISKGRIDTTRIRFISDESAKSIEKCRVREGNIILVRSGAYTGDCARIPAELDGAYAAYDLILTVDEQHALPEVIEYLLLSPYGQAQIGRVKIRSGQPHLNAKDTSALKFPIPPLELQHVFAEAYHRLRNNLFPLFEKTAKTQTNLFQSLLARAFTGELTATWRETHAEELRAAAAERDRLLGLATKPKEVSVEIVGDERALSQALSGFSRLAEHLAAGNLQAALPDFTRFAESLRPNLQPLAAEVNRGLAASLEPLADELKEQLLANVRPLTEALHARYAPEFVALAEKIAELARLQLEEPIPRREVEARVLAVAADGDTYFTLPDLVTDWRLNHFPRRTIQEAVDMLVVRGELRPATLKLETGDPERPYALVPAYALVRDEDKISADEIDL